MSPSRKSSLKRGTKLGAYTVEDFLAEGGLGELYRARDQHRTVAIKIIRKDRDGNLMRRRFAFEADVLARLHHPSIPHFYGYSDGKNPDGSQGQPFIAMESIEGPRSLVDHLETTARTVRARLALFAEIAETVGYVNDCGIVHRDVKPDNILIDGRGRHKLIDFGVARAPLIDSREPPVSELWQLVGTVDFMSPEQCAGDPLAIDAGTDIYSLGVTLFLMLTGRLPYNTNGLTREQAAALIMSPPPLPKFERPDLRGDVELIVRKAMATDRSERYATAHALAEDVRNYLGGRALSGGKPGLWYSLQLLQRRSPGALRAGVAAVVAIAILLTATVTSIIVARGHKQQKLALRERLAADQRSALAREHHRAATRAAEEGRLRAAVWHTVRAVSQESEVSADSWLRLAHYADRISSPARAERHAAGLPPIFVPGRPIPTFLTVDGGELTLRAPSAKGDRQLDEDPPNISDIAVSPDGAYVVVARANRAVILRIADEAKIGLPVVHARRITAVGFSSDGSRLIIAGGDGKISVVTLDTAKLETLDHGTWIQTAALDADGSHVLTVDQTGLVCWWDRETGEVLRRFRHDGPTTCAELAPDGTHALTVGDDEHVRLWQLEGRPDGSVARSLTHAGVVRVARFSRDGRFILTVTVSGTLRVWSVETGEPVAGPRDYPEPVAGARFSDDGATVVIAGERGGVRLWDVGNDVLGRAHPHRAGVRDARLGPNGRFLLTAAGDDVMRSWTLGRSGSRVTRAVLRAGTFDDSGTRLAGLVEGRARFHRLAANGAWEPSDLKLEDAPPLLAIAFGGSDSSLVMGMCDDEGHTVRLWTRSDGKLYETFEHRQSPYAAALSPNGRHLVVATEGELIFWNVADRTHTVVPKERDGAVAGVAFSGDGKLVAVAYQQGAVTIFDPVNGVRTRAPIDHGVRIRNLMFGRGVAATLLLVVGTDGRVFAWAADDREADAPLAVLPPRGGGGGGEPLRGAVVTPDRRFLILAWADGTVSLWNREAGEIVVTLRKRGVELTSMAMSPAGERLMVSDSEGTWVLELPRASRLPVAVLDAWARWRTGVSMDEAGSLKPLERDAWLVARDTFLASAPGRIDAAGP